MVSPTCREAGSNPNIRVSTDATGLPVVDRTEDFLIWWLGPEGCRLRVPRRPTKSASDWAAGLRRDNTGALREVQPFDGLRP